MCQYAGPGPLSASSSPTVNRPPARKRRRPEPRKRNWRYENALYRGGRKPDMFVPQRRPSQDDGQDYRRPARYGRGYAGAGPADPFQAGTNDGYRL